MLGHTGHHGSPRGQPMSHEPPQPTTPAQDDLGRLGHAGLARGGWLSWSTCAQIDPSTRAPRRPSEVLTVPLQVYDIAGDARNVADVLHWGTTLYWALDVPASFLTAVYINDVLHTSFTDVARAYLKSWFVFDALMLVPEVVVFVNTFSPMPGVATDDATASGLLRALRARRLMKVVRFIRILRFRKAVLVLKEEDELLQAV